MLQRSKFRKRGVLHASYLVRIWGLRAVYLGYTSVVEAHRAGTRTTLN